MHHESGGAKRRNQNRVSKFIPFESVPNLNSWDLPVENWAAAADDL